MGNAQALLEQARYGIERGQLQRRICALLKASRSEQVIKVPARLISLHGTPGYLRSDNSPEFVSTKLLQWAVEAQLKTVLIKPGRMAPIKASMANFVMSAWLWKGFKIILKPKSSSKTGGAIAMSADRTQV